MASYLVGLWSAITFVLAFAGLIKICKPKLPQWFDDIFLYGKTKANQRSTWGIIRFIEIPKSAFLYFYYWGDIVCTAVLILAVRSYVFGIVPPAEIQNLLQTLFQDLPSGSSVPWVVSTTATSSFIVCILSTCQLIRRTLECWFVHVYSKGTMNLLHCVLGILFYSSVSLSALAEAPPLSSTVADFKAEFFALRHIIGINLFLIAAYYHNQVNRQFASMRKNKAGKVTTYQHRIPHGGLFEYVSCPHYFTECLVYTAMYITLGFNHITFLVLLIFVYVNQFLLAWFTHAWYKQTFKTYPSKRRAFIPYIL